MGPRVANELLGFCFTTQGGGASYKTFLACGANYFSKSSSYHNSDDSCSVSLSPSCCSVEEIATTVNMATRRTKREAVVKLPKLVS